MDFTLKEYKNLLRGLLSNGYIFQSFEEFIQNPNKKSVILRHDVDHKPKNSLSTAIIENHLSLKGSYYFRIVPECFDLNIIRQIADLGHEIGYHYETMDFCYGDLDAAFNEFCRNIEIFRNIVPVRTICMHGSPCSNYDNREIWKKYDYRELGIIGEPYFDVNFNNVLYLTDTGRRWDGYKFSIRDKVPQQQEWIKHGLVFKTTKKIITAANQGMLPNQIMITLHPQRWTNKPITWIKELVIQNSKNIIKYSVIKVKQKKQLNSI